MKPEYIEIRAQGRTLRVPSSVINGRRVISRGKWLKVAAVQDEDFIEGEVIQDPADFVAKLKAEEISADIFTFVQKLPDTTPKYQYRLEWDNVAAIPTTTCEEWSKQRLSQRLGAVSERTIESVEDQIKIVLDLHPWSFSADRGHLTP